MKTRLVLAASLCLCAACSVVVCRAMGKSLEGKKPVPTAANAERELAAALEGIVNIRELQAARSELEVEAGMATFSDMAEAKVQVWHSRIRLARSREESVAVLKGLRCVIDLREDVLRHIKKEMQRGTASAVAIETARLQLLEARVDFYDAILGKQKGLCKP